MSDLFTFPLGLPQPDINLAGNTDTMAVRLDMESGRSRQRRRFSIDRLILNVQWTLSTLECNVLRAFLKWKLNDGVDQFYMPIIFGGGQRIQTMRFVDGKLTYTYQENGFWMVVGQLEQIFDLSFCTPNLVGFLTVPGGDKDLSAYFNVPVTSPGVATQWRLQTDGCGYNIQYYLGTINDDGTLNPGTNLTEEEDVDITGWHSNTLLFHSDYPYAEGMYLQLNCGGVWAAPLPCIAGGNGSPD